MPKLPKVIWLNHANSYSQEVVGDKGLDLGKLHQGQLPILPGFVIPASFFQSLLTEDLKQTIYRVFDTIHPHTPESIHGAAHQLQRLILQAPITEEVAVMIADAYQELGEKSFVAVRSSATHAKLPPVHATFLNIQGDANAFEAIKKVWASVYDPKRVAFMYEHGLDPAQAHIAVVVQAMSQSSVAGILYTQNPLNRNKKTVVIRAVWGLGEYLAEHENEADTYEIVKYTYELLQETSQAQRHELKRKLGTTKQQEVPISRKDQPKLTSAQRQQLVDLAVKVQQFLFFPQKVEWSIENDAVYILQTQPLTEVVPISTAETVIPYQHLRPLFYGTGVQKGLVAGPVRLLRSEADWKKIKPDEIVVVNKLTPGHATILKHVRGIICDQPVYPRDFHHLSVPILANTHFATAILKNNQMVTLASDQGAVFDGAAAGHTTVASAPALKPHTQLFLSTGEPNKVGPLVKSVDGVGLLRAEYLISQLGTHPKHLLRHGKAELFIHHLATGIGKVCETFKNKPVTYRLSDFTSQEYAELKGGTDYEPQEKNPLLGYRGAYRFLTDRDLLEMEIEAFLAVSERHSNLRLMVPFVRSLDEWLLLRTVLTRLGISFAQTPVWLMVDTPSVALSVGDYLTHDIAGVAIGARDLLSLSLGIDLDADEAQRISDQDPGFLSLIRQIITTTHAHHLPVQYCEHQVSQRMVEFLKDQQVDGISVNASQVEFVRKFLKEH